MDPQHPTHPDEHPDAAPGEEAYPAADPSDAAANDAASDAANDPVQAAVRTLLMTAPDPGPMPAELSRRIEDSLAQAAGHRAGDHELFDELGFGEPGAVVPVDASNDLIVFPGGSEHDNGGHGGDDRVVPLPRRRWPLIGAVAAGVALLAIAAAVVANQSRSGDNGLATIPPGGSTGGSAGSVHIQVSSTAYAKDSLVAGAQTLITSPGPDASVGDAPSAGPLVTQAGAAACVNALGASDAGAVSIDLATYEGQPAAIVVVRRTDSTTVYAVQRDCGDGDAGILQDSVPVP
ncbi:MAG TPA: hypothetical protein VIE19_09825 [Lapillicoccus sp.]|jgi:hypothetical protein